MQAGCVQRHKRSVQERQILVNDVESTLRDLGSKIISRKINYR